MYSDKLFIILVLIFTTSLTYAQVVSDVTQLNDAISAAAAGTTITLADGTWSDVFIDIDKEGTANDPIIITAQNPGAVFMTGNSRIYLEGSHITISGLVFQNPSNLDVDGDKIKPIIELKRCDYCKVINNKIDAYNGTEFQKTLTFKWILTDGQYNEIAYNSFIGKYGVGSIINDNRNSTPADYLKIHHNYFADRTPINRVNDDNDQDAIRIGNSSTSLTNSFTEVYDNYFYNFIGEVEVISNKSGQNKYYNNTFRDYSGTLTLRHGDNCEVYGNYFFAEDNIFSGGIRVIGEGHKIYNNYIEGVNSIKPDGSRTNTTGGINVSNGRRNSELNGYYQVKNTQVINNTFVDCDYGLRIGTQVKSDLDQEPTNLTVANNIMYNSSIEDYQIITEPSGNSRSEGNITNLPNSDLVDDGDFHRLTDGSSPIDAGVGNYSFLTQDILGGSRESDFDIGAEEFGANGTRLPFTELDVGVTIGFGTMSNPVLLLAPSTISFGKSGGETKFEVVSNIDWTITEDLSWLSLDISSGSGSTTITASATENMTEVERTGTISINDMDAATDLASQLSVVQLNTFLAAEIPIDATTSLGTQDQNDISEENAYNDNIENYWTGDPDTEAEVSITFDLSCTHILTEIGINFWKANERATTFSIAVADDASGPFTTVIDNETSATANVTVNTEQLFSLNGASGRYVKFIGIGNSSSTNWTSIANINIYGNIDCEGTTSLFNIQKTDLGISLFPVPVISGKLTIQSTSKALKAIEVFNIVGQRILMFNGNHKYSKQIDVSSLKSGVYFIKIKDIGQSKFIVK